jgi:urea transport system substrate-binding protein
MSCPSPQILNDLMANRLPAGQVDLIREHIANCPKCDGSGQLNPQQESVYPFLEPAQERGEIARLGDYRILGLLGEGGMAIVFEAEDSKLHRKVALKVLRPEKCTLEMRERFLREARLLASLPHNHIVAVFSVDEANGVPFMAMERLEGMTLEQRLRQDQTLPLDESLSIARQIAEGLQAVHEKELVHRDVKPANIWLETTREGRFRRVKSARFRDCSSNDGRCHRVTLSGQIVGTPSYMAPEQALGLPVDRRSDLYSLGCVLFRMLVGRPPLRVNRARRCYSWNLSSKARLRVSASLHRTFPHRWHG